MKNDLDVKWKNCLQMKLAIQSKEEEQRKDNVNCQEIKHRLRVRAQEIVKMRGKLFEMIS